MDTALLLSGVVGIGIAAQWLAWYLKQPSILFLLLIGIIVGPVLGVFDPDLVLGELMFPFISLGVAIILFEGSLTLEFDEIKQHGTVVQMLVSVGVLITIAIVALSTYLLFDVDPLIALLFGALVCVTGPTVIMPLLRSVRPNKTISNILKWEGIIIDPIGAIAVVLVYEYIISGGEASSILLFAKIVVLATALGMAGAWLLAFLMRRHMVPEFLRNVFTLAFVLVLFSVSNHLEHESGLLTVTVLGVALANWPKFPREADAMPPAEGRAGGDSRGDPGSASTTRDIGCRPRSATVPAHRATCCAPRSGVSTVQTNSIRWYRSAGGSVNRSMAVA